ncbi:E3 ubiquitin-protein ligase TRIM21-like [Phascolarctos cinereus]
MGIISYKWGPELGMHGQVSQVREFPAVSGSLAQLTDLGRQLCSQLLQTTKGQSQCARHKQALKLFSEDDHTPLCVRCSQSPEHGAHKLCSIEEAAHNCREKLQHIRSHLGKHLEENEKLFDEKETPAVDWHWMIHQFLMLEEARCLERMEEEEREAGHQPNVDLLQEVKQLLGRSQSVLSQRAKAVTPELREYPIPGMIEILRGFRVDITMDPMSASPCVIVSEDQRSVEAGEGWQVETRHPEDPARHYVFAEQAFSSGRQYWEVDVTQLPQWILGISTPHLRRKSGRNMDSCASAFLLRCVKKEEDYYFQACPRSLNHRVTGPVPRVGVFLEYASGTLVFYNVLQSTLIYKFYPILFTPIFSPGPPLPGTKAGTMTVCPVDSHLCA